MLRQTQHETRRALQPELIEGKLSTLGLSHNTNAIMLRQAQHEDLSGLHPELVEG
jgi:hypothetical protein